MNNRRGGGGLKLSSLSLLEEVRQHLEGRLPLVPADDPYLDELVLLERLLNDCRLSAQPAQSAHLPAPVSPVVSL
jgi:hypothetical protein